MGHSDKGPACHHRRAFLGQKPYFTLLLPVCRLPVAVATQTGAGTGREESWVASPELPWYAFPECRQIDVLDASTGLQDSTPFSVLPFGSTGHIR